MVLDFSCEFMVTQSFMIVDCYEKTMKNSLRDRLNIPRAESGEGLARALFNAPLAILSHDVVLKNGKRDNIYNYANKTALRLFERSFEEQIGLPSSKSTRGEDSPQGERNNILAQCLSEGRAKFDTVRYSATGKVVPLCGALLFNLFNRSGVYCGQAVIFDPPVT